MVRIKWNKEKALLGWLLSERHKEFLVKELDGEIGAINAFYDTKKYIIEGKQSNFIKDYTYDKYMADFKKQGINPDVI